MRHCTQRTLLWLVAISLAGGCSKEKGLGGVVGFATGTEKPGTVPADGTSPDAPQVTGLTLKKLAILNGEPLAVEVSFEDTQGDLATIYFGIERENVHYMLPVTIASRWNSILATTSRARIISWSHSPTSRATSAPRSSRSS